ncbi:tripartite-type tricarboxylate transporter receptor subunit TctC [Caldalkalibacillus uzonensis]|uniref:Tripartite-type tricarboxylate transporter receptor subunit TctC n=1 Tax=Caldalkalibacillus uzonensis TaxID=353224 RepID=A0ABU0CNG8_9BACI|nr:tripartite tricarboxylate transporter substrate binding protein [Caldalkalibacillus uzonensis]MDQ0337960.1 tripartite-type tricarboxylate transporter receptor subunit TctC [Caldalkalibacillus uzonensis]
MKKCSVLLSITLMMALFLSACSSSTSVEDYPNRNIITINPFSAGGTTDVNLRLIESLWTDYFETNMVIEYKTGAGGEVGFTELAKAKPDGYTIGAINTPHIILQPLGRPTEFDTDSFDILVRLVSDPQVLAVRADSEFDRLDQFIDHLKQNPRSLTVGMTGTLTGDHLTTLMFMDRAGVEVNPTPFQGAADQVAALLGGHVDAIMGNVGDVAKEPQQFKVLAVATEERHEWLPDAPTFKEQGIDLVAAIDRGLAMPKGSPREAYEKLYEALEKITDLPEYLEGMENAGLPPAFLSGDEWAKLIEEQKQEAESILEQFNEIN